MSSLEQIFGTVVGLPRHLRLLGIKKLTSRPPRYDVHLAERTLRRVEWDDLRSSRKFASLVGQELDFIPVPIKQSDWEGRLNKLLEQAEIDEAPPDASEEEQIKLTVIKHIRDSRPATDPSDLQSARPYFRDGFYHVSSQPLIHRLREKYRLMIKSNDLYALIREWGGKKVKLKLGKKDYRVWALPKELIEEEEAIPEEQPSGELPDDL